MGKLSRNWGRRAVLPFFLTLGVVLGAGCFAGPPVGYEQDPICPAPGDVSAPFPADLPKGTTSPAGRFAGQFSVTSTGEARYAMPIVVPPGRAGIEPQLAIVYSSGSGDGPLGMGFSLSGFSVVTRCSKTIARDGEIRGIRFDGEDALCLDGRRLVEVGSGDGFREFRTFPDTFAKNIAEFPTGWDAKKGPKRLKVYSKDGAILTYGDDAEQGTPISWWIACAEDRNGNFIEYHYRKDPGEVVPEFIDYTGHPKAPATRRVSFEYTKKPQLARRTYFRSGVELRSTLQLTKIKTVVHDKLVRELRLTQSPSTTTGRMRLDQIEECAADGVCKRPTSFGWNTPTVGFKDIKTPLLLPTSPRASVMPLDANGDGLDDVVVMDFPPWDPDAGEQPTTQVKVAMNAGPDAAKPFLQPFVVGAQRVHYNEDVSELAVPEPEAATPLDVNHDGRADLLLHDVYGRGPYWKLLVQQPDHTFSFLQTNIARPFPSVSYVGAGVNTPDASGHLADVTGDGMVDLIQCRWLGPEPEWFLHRWTPGGFELNGTALANLAAQPCDTELYPVDVDGDGTSELLMREAKVAGLEALFLANYIIAKFDASGTVTLSDPKLAVPPTGGGTYFVDCNGDGLSDVLQWGFGDGFHAFINTGLGFDKGRVAAFDPIAPLEKHARLLVPMDLEGDGLQDLLIPVDVAGGVKWRALRSRGDGTFALGDVNVPFDAALTDEGVKLADPHGPRPIEIDGDGAPDLLLPVAGQFHVLRNQAAHPDVLLSVTDGMAPYRPGEAGHRPSVAITYETLVDPSVDSKAPQGSFLQDALPYVSRYDQHNACEYPLRCVVAPRRVVTGYSLDTGAEKPRRFGLRYRDGRWHRLGGGFLGFGMRIVDDLDTKSGTATVFDVGTWDEELRAFPFAGEVKASWSWAPSREPQNDDTIEVGYSSTVLSSVSTNQGATFFTIAGLRRDVHAQGHFWAYENPFETAESYARGVMNGSEPAAPISDVIRVVGDVDTVGNVLAATTFYGRDHGIPLTPANTSELVERVERTFKNDEANWLVGLLEEQMACRKVGTEGACATTRMQHDKLGQLRVIERESAGDDETKLSVSLTPDVFGNIVKTAAVDVFGARRTACTSYDQEGVFPFAKKNALGHRWFEKYDPGSGAELAAIDPNELVTQRAVDGFGRITKVVRPDVPETTTTMAVAQDVSTKARHVEITESTPGWGEETAALDLLGRTVRTWSTGVSVSGQLAPRILREVVYDDIGEQIARAYVPDAENTSEAARKFELTEFDALGRVKRVVSPWGGVSTRTYSGGRVIEKNARKFITETELDSLGRPVTVKDPEHVTTYEYGPTGLRKVIAPGNAVTILERDALGRVRSSQDPDRGALDVHYNGFGDVRSTKDALGREVRNTHDGLGRISEQKDDDGITSWTWDTQFKGALSEVHSPEGTIQRTLYDEKARVRGSDLVLGGETFSIRYDRNDQGWVTRVKYPGFAVQNDFDDAGHLIGVRHAETLDPYWMRRTVQDMGATTLDAVSDHAHACEDQGGPM